MGRRRARSPFEDNPVINGFLEWMDAPEGHSIEALICSTHWNMPASTPGSARSSGPGKRLSIELSAERIHAEHPDVACDVIETHVLGWLGSVRRKPTPSANSRDSTAHRTVARRL